ncbi:MAG: hypothetical protein N3F65_01670 [Nitrososphaeria archaeon]|nr:hypothetical protein [Aigarchaeota archaeon]MCX8187301.1 hypothetical protein [Nitrososphaeria archaeon]MDW8021414.1 helix-turn-helix domain-containing protein [Nitrososphaerota archaeon]
MSGDRGVIEALKKLGLTDYEARAYVAVVELGEAEASEVAMRSGVPRTRIYDVLSRLENRGFIQRIRGARPAVYAAIHPERGLEPLKNQLIVELSESIRYLNKLYLSSRPISKCEVSLLRGVHAYRAALELLDNALGDLLVRVVYFPSEVFETLADKLRRIRERGVRIHLTIDISLLEKAIPRETINKVLEELGGRPVSSPIPLSFFVADFRDVLLLFVAPDSPENCYGFLLRDLGEVSELLKKHFAGL